MASELSFSERFPTFQDLLEYIESEDFVFGKARTQISQNIETIIGFLIDYVASEDEHKGYRIYNFLVFLMSSERYDYPAVHPDSNVVIIILEALIEKGFDISSISDKHERNNLLHHSVKFYRPELFRFLIEYDIGLLSKKNLNGQTPLDFFSDNGGFQQFSKIIKEVQESDCWSLKQPDCE